MHPHLSIIKLALQKTNWEQLKDLAHTDFPEELQPIWLALEAQYTKTDVESLSELDLAALLFTNSVKKQELYTGIVDTLLKHDVSEQVTHELVKQIKLSKVFRELSLKAYDAAEGRASLDDIRLLTQQLDVPVEDNSPSPFVIGSLSELLGRTYEQMGLRWRTPWLNKALGSLRRGDFGFVFARPETGKTTFLASEVSFMAEQLADDAGPIIWFNNEEQGDKVYLRVYQASLGVDLISLRINVEVNDKQFIKNTKDKIKIVDRANISKSFVEQICRKYKPSLIIFDQIDKIQGFKADREDLMLGSIYVWARELAKYYCPVIGICQSGGTGENIRYLTMNHVANAHTAKQAEADWILGIGFIHDTGWENIRFFNISKNKLQGDVDSDPKLRHGKTEILIQPEIARYREMS